MNKIHITLVGGQPAPVYHGIVATQPDTVVYIHSNDVRSRRALQSLLNEVNVPSESIMLDVTLPNKIKECAESLAEKYKNDEVTVNISSGLKTWSHWFGVIFDKYPNAAVVYMDQNNVLWNYRTMTPSANFEFDMHTLLRLYGNSLQNNYTKFDDYTEDDFTAVKEIEKLRKINFQDFKALTTVLARERTHLLRNSKTGTFTAGDSFVQWDKNQLTVRFGMSKRGELHEVSISSPHIMNIAFNAGWFETKIAKILSEWSKAKNICLNCCFPFRENIAKNEVDILVDTGVKILFIECKTQITNTTDINKFRSVIKGYGGTSSKGLFITDSKMTDMAKEICKEQDILSFSLQDYAREDEAKKALFQLLNTELRKINA